MTIDEQIVALGLTDVEFYYLSMATRCRPGTLYIYLDYATWIGPGLIEKGLFEKFDASNLGTPSALGRELIPAIQELGDALLAARMLHKPAWRPT